MVDSMQLQKGRIIEVQVSLQDTKALLDAVG
jgi:hypothetical protein